MNILIVGGGGREHALAWKLSQSRRVRRLYCAPGNAGIAELADCLPINPTDVEQLATVAVERQIDLTVVGPEAPLCAGLADAFHARGKRIFGPNRQAAQLEGSKVFAKQFMLRYGVPTAAAEICDTPEAARAAIRRRGAPVVVKADGLAAGKGVVVAQTVAEAEAAVEQIMVRAVFGAAGRRVTIEECLNGAEASVMAFVDGQSYQLLAAAQDHKRVFDGDCGPNTGGMGAYSPTPVVGPQHEAAIRNIFDRTLAGLQAERIEYRGILYAGLMMTDSGPKVLEFNCRFGDPETQAVVPRMDFDLLDVMEAVAADRLPATPLPWKPDAAVCVVLAAQGYPGAYAKGQPITGLKEAAAQDRVFVFHAGTKRTASGEIVTDGGRVLGVTALDTDLRKAVQRVYAAVKLIHFDGMHYRRDIAARALRPA